MFTQQVVDLKEFTAIAKAWGHSEQSLTEEKGEEGEAGGRAEKQAPRMKGDHIKVPVMKKEDEEEEKEVEEGVQEDSLTSMEATSLRSRVLELEAQADEHRMLLDEVTSFLRDGAALPHHSP